MEFKRDNGIIRVEADEEEFKNNKIYRDNINSEVDAINNDIDDFGASECCESGRVRYHGGSRYYCTECGTDEIRPAHGFVAIATDLE